MQWLRRLEGSRLAIAGLVVAAVLFVAVNVLAGAVLRGDQIDLTEGKLYTVSDGTRRLMASLDEPVQLRLYFSQRMGQVAPQFAAYHARVRELLERYVSLSNGRLGLELLEPEPFSDAEDRAVADGLQGVPLSQTGEMGYFGLAGSNSLDGRAVIPFFNLEREPFLEYDLTKLIHGLANTQRPVLGLISALPVAGGTDGSPAVPPPLLVLDQLREFFTVEDIDPQASSIPETVKTLMIIDLARLGGEMLRAVDRFVHQGGRALVFADPYIESLPMPRPPAENAAAPEDVAKLLRAWGVVLVDGKVAGDIDGARRVSSGERGGTVGEYVPWISLGRSNFDTGDPVMANVERLNLATSGILEPAQPSAVTFTPMVFTGPRAMAIDVGKVQGRLPDIMGLLREYQPGGKPLTLAARIVGPAPAAFAVAPPAEGKPAAEAAAPTETKPVQLIVVADADMLYDRFWVQVSDFFGQRVEVPNANNADFVVNAVENLAEADALIGLRGRGTSYRPFTLIDELRRDAETLYRSKEQALQQRLKDLEQQLQGVRQRGDAQGGEVMLSADDKAAIERFRGEMLAVRKDLRNVQHALRSDIERLEERIKLANIAAVPLLLCAVGGGVALTRRLRRSKAKRQGGLG